MNSDNPLEQIGDTLHSWNNDEAPFRAVQMLVGHLGKINQTFKSITSEMTAKGTKVEGMCEKTRREREERSQNFQKWLDLAKGDSDHFSSALADIDKRETPSDDDNVPQELYRDFDNSDELGKSLDRKAFSTWIEQQRHLFNH